MTILLIANVGNRDVWVDKAAPVPGDAHPQWNRDASRRALGTALQAGWEACRPFVRLPIIGKAARYVQQEAGRLDRVALISSDQSGQLEVSDRYLQQDTCTLAPVAERLLIDRYGVAEGAVEHWTVQENPADYGAMRAFYRARLDALRAAHPRATFYLEVSGGTPAMTSMLLAVGAEILGLDARPLYVTERDEQPYPLDIGRRLVADALIRTLQADLDIYAYHAALQTVRDHHDLLREFVDADALAAVLDYARERINFNFEQARNAVQIEGAAGWEDALAGLSAALDETRAEWLLREIVINAEIKLRTGALGDFLVRMFRFDEAALRHTAQRLGARLVDRKGWPDADGEFLDPTWLGADPDLDAYLAGKDVRRDRGRAPANRHVLTLVITHLARRQGDVNALALKKELEKMNPLSGVRNRSFAVHNFEGVSRQRIAQAIFGSDAQGTEQELREVLDMVRDACEAASGRALPETNPYDDLNALCQDMLAGKGRA